VFLKDLQTGEELHLNPDVPFTGGGVMKLPIAVEIYRKYELPLDVTTTQRLTAALTRVEQSAGESTAQSNWRRQYVCGRRYRQCLVGQSGLRNSYLAQPFDQPITATNGLSTPANSNPAINTNPSPAIQTTANDMGLLWEMIDQCSQSGGALLVVYPISSTRSNVAR